MLRPHKGQVNTDDGVVNILEVIEELSLLGSRCDGDGANTANH